MQQPQMEDSPATPEDTRPQFDTVRMNLRPFQMDDEAEVYRICKEKEIAAFTSTIPHPYPREQAEHWIKQHPENWRQGKSIVFALCLKENDRVIGSMGLTFCERDQNAELGYVVEKESWGKGYCTEAATGVLQYAFDSLALHKVHAHHMVNNPGSGRVLEKIGMKEEGYLRGHIRKWGVFHDVRCWGILASEFRKR